MNFADWKNLPARAAAARVHTSAANLPAAQRKAALAWLAAESVLGEQLAASQSESHPLAGIPFAAKDLFDAAGLPTFAGSTFLPEVRVEHQPGGLAASDGSFIREVRASGGVLAAKAHMHEFAYGITGENPHYGDCELPGHAGRTTGGSSSGSALLVKAGVVPLALGSDTGGSIRVPAAFCGLYGFRMTPGHPWIADGFPLAESLDTPGFLTSFASDLRIVLDALLPESAPRTRGLRGAWMSLPGLDAEVQAAYSRAASALTSPLPESVAGDLRELFAPAADLYAILGGAETWRIHAPFYDLYRSRYDPNVRARIDRARTLTPDEIATAQANRDAITRAWDGVFREYDYVVLPATPCAAPVKADCTVDTRRRILSCTVPASMASLPVLALPFKLESGLTSAVQIVVPHLRSPAIRDMLDIWGVQDKTLKR